MNKAAWAEIETYALTHNLDVIRDKVGPGVRICAVLKADAYGHGMPGVERCLCSRHLADMAAVGKMSEMEQLFRKAPKESLPVLLLGAVEASEVSERIKYQTIIPERAIFSIYSLRQFRDLEALGKILGLRLHVHIRVDGWDSGMGLGYQEYLDAEEELFSARHLDICGIYSHLYSSYSGNTAQIHQDLERFDRFVRKISPEYRKQMTVHILNSSLVFLFPEYAYDMIRTGTALYGLPCGDKGRLRTAMRICAKVFDVRDIDISAPLSYESGQPSTSSRRIARIMLGYWDCPLLLTQHDIRIRIRGRTFFLADEACMDNLCIDITGEEDIRPGDVATLLGEEGVTLEEILRRNHINYAHSEWLCMTAVRLEKVYL